MEQTNTHMVIGLILVDSIGLIGMHSFMTCMSLQKTEGAKTREIFILYEKICQQSSKKSGERFLLWYQQTTAELMQKY